MEYTAQIGAAIYYRNDTKEIIMYQAEREGYVRQTDFLEDIEHPNFEGVPLETIRCEVLSYGANLMAIIQQLELYFKEAITNAEA